MLTIFSLKYLTASTKYYHPHVSYVMSKVGGQYVSNKNNPLQMFIQKTITLLQQVQTGTCTSKYYNATTELPFVHLKAVKHLI